jgi:hypothetical protein
MLLTLIIKSPDLSIAASSISIFDNPNIEVGIGGKCSILFIIFRSFLSISELYHFSVSTQTIKEPIIFLPPYSPDFNPIEKFWAIIKR